jgi:hypothetical protein
MSNVLDFLERVGQEPQLRYATRSQLLEAMARAEMDADLQSVILAGDGRALEALLGINASSCCLIHAPDDDEPEPEEAPDDGGDDDGKEDDGPTPKRPASRRGAAAA